ncbi:MAG: hypothetical protein ACLFP4_14845 [Spirochaetales bacterium]
MKHWRTLAALLLLVAAGAFAQDDGTDEDALFGGGLIEETEENADVDDAVNDLLTNDGTEVGGGFDLSIRLATDPEEVNEFSDLIDETAPSYSLGSTVFIDARPDPDFRVFLKTQVEYDTELPDPGASITVEELFSDVSLSDSLFLRAGKQNMAWGVGYFFSPADLVSLESIDPDNPDAELEGPVAVRLHYPIGTTNMYAYTMLDNFPNTGHAGYAAKLEFVVGNSEITTGGYFEQDAVSGLMATYSGSVGDFDLFAEVVGQYGSTITIVREDGPLLVADDREDEWFPLATGGFRYSWSDELGNFNLSFIGQYFYNGQGYEDPSILQDPRVGTLLGAGEIGFSDFVGTGRHYGSALASWSNAFDSDWSPSTFWIGNLSDGSGRVSLDVRYRINDYFSVTPGYSYAYGEEGDEYAPFGDDHVITLGATLGAGRF